MLRKFAVAAALVTAMACTLTTSPAFAQTPPVESPPVQTPPGQPPAESDSTIVIFGQKDEEAVRAFVAEIGEGPKGVNLARWGRKICVGVMNVTPDYAQKLIDHVSLMALAVGLEPGEPGCRANVMIIAHTDGNGLATRLVKDHPRMFQPWETFDDNLGRDALRRFQTSGAPVRWWHVSQPVLTDTGQPIMRGQSVQVRGSGRLRGNVLQAISHAMIILDTTQIGTVSFNKLADYVGVVALAQIDAEADVREFPTIMNMFGSDTVDQTARLTDWDLDYLTALYETPGDAASSKTEASRIARNMLKP
jgi:hypothetical protein